MADKRTDTGSLGAGGEAAAGMHAEQEDNASQDTTTGRGREGGAGGADRAGSEPLARSHEHEGSYGGKAGAPRTSSDTRELPPDPSPS